jgi:hypothetical protein
MRLLLALPLPLLLAACDVQRDEANDSTTVSFNEQRLENAVEDVGNAAESAGGAIENEVRDLDIDVDINRNDSDANANRN